jgi:methionyl-tRNA synthetase
MSKPFYLTTPLYYVNAAPHIGHSYTQVAADALARFHRLSGREVHFLTGTDEHGQKIEQAAQAKGQTPQAFVDEVVQRFTGLWQLLHISHDDFIRTTQPRHQRIVQACLTTLRDRGALVHTTYDGWYCTPDETFWTEQELAKTEGAAPACPACGRPVERVTEDGWYLPLRAHQAWLTGFLKAHPGFIQPSTRYNELMSLLDQPLPEALYVTRPKHRVAWGIPVPFSDAHVTYVWFDALLNYISAVGYQQDPARFARLWPADVHIIGKDILRHHTLYWPIILHALGFSDEQMPRMVFAHGWWKVGEQKMSKSLGNIIDPYVVVREVLKDQPHAADVYRYFLLRDVPFGQDGAFSEEALRARLGSDLGNDLGNLLQRTHSMIERYCQSQVPAREAATADDEALQQTAQGLPARLEEALRSLNFAQALEAIFQVVGDANRYIEAQAPWQLSKAGQTARLHAVLATLAETIRIVAIALEPFMPTVSAAMWRQLGLGSSPRRLADAGRWPALSSGHRLGARAVLFPRQVKA